MDKDNIFNSAQALFDAGLTLEQVKNDLQKKYSPTYTAEEIENAILHAASPELKDNFRKVNYAFAGIALIALLTELFRKFLFSEVIQPQSTPMANAAAIGALLPVVLVCSSLLWYALKFKRITYRAFIFLFLVLMLQRLSLFNFFIDMNAIAQISIIIIYASSIISVFLAFFLLKKVWPGRPIIFSKY